MTWLGQKASHSCFRRNDKKNLIIEYKIRGRVCMKRCDQFSVFDSPAFRHDMTKPHG
ncbi:Uncharacterized protein dnm_049250 [Desulfonema magnum]|uniref:Uncharacterized protein n=1 Tax=Desulfonema magnum TaxID=45655 RepID=A0A975BPB8_9BACT|nr:Uncharacterized protein dnm_049250 [Desulfonema magnum]